MKILISSESLFQALNSLPPFSIIHSVSCTETELYLHLDNSNVVIDCITSNKINELNQSNVRWDWIKETVRTLTDRPITVELGENTGRIILDF